MAHVKHVERGSTMTILYAETTDVRWVDTCRMMVGLPSLCFLPGRRLAKQLTLMTSGLASWISLIWVGPSVLVASLLNSIRLFFAFASPSLTHVCIQIVIFGLLKFVKIARLLLLNFYEPH